MLRARKRALWNTVIRSVNLKRKYFFLLPVIRCITNPSLRFTSTVDGPTPGDRLPPHPRPAGTSTLSNDTAPLKEGNCKTYRPLHPIPNETYPRFLTGPSGAEEVPLQVQI